MPSLSDIEDFLETHHRTIAEGIDTFGREVLDPLPPAADDADARRQARAVLTALGEAGWARLAVAEPGAEAPDLRACCLVRERLAASSPLADAVFALQCLGTLPLSWAGSEALREEWIPKVASGSAMAAFAMTEPAAGSDAGGMETTASVVDGGYELNGRKWFISNAGIADFYTVFATLDPAAGTRGVGCFFVSADTPGLRFAGAQTMSEPHPLGEMVFESCRIPATMLLAGAGDGFKLGMRTLDRLRVTVAAAACGMAGRALAEAILHAEERRQFGRRLADFQLTQARIAQMSVEHAAARLLTYRAAVAADRGEDGFTLRSASAKLFATEAAQRIVDGAVQILGGRGVLAESFVDRLYRSVRALRIYEGASEIQQLVIARQLLRPRDS